MRLLNQLGISLFTNHVAKSKKKQFAATGDIPKKPRKDPRQTDPQVGLLFFLLIIGGMVFMFVKGLNSKPAGKMPSLLLSRNLTAKSRDGVNILILGTDGRIGEKSDETRTDSIMVVNVNNKEGKIKMVSFMRDTLVHIDGVSQQNIP